MDVCAGRTRESETASWETVNRCFPKDTNRQSLHIYLWAIRAHSASLERYHRLMVHYVHSAHSVPANA